MPENYPRQRKLFEELIKRSKSKRIWIDRYMQANFISKSTCYERINGKIPISFDEGMQLAAHYEVPLDLCSQHPIATDSKELANLASFEATPEKYLTFLYNDLAQIASMPDAFIWHQTDQSPIFCLKHSRLLAAFKIYYWYRLLAIRSGKLPPIFDENWKSAPKIAHLLDQCRSILNTYQSIPSEEVWSVSLFDNTILQMEDALDTGGIDQAMFNQLLLELHKVIEILYEIVRTGHKRTENSEVKIKVYENRVPSGLNLILGKSAGHQFQYFDMGYPDFIRDTDTALIEDRIQRFHLMQPHWNLLSESHRTIFHFFQRLRSRIPRSLPEQ